MNRLFSILTGMLILFLFCCRQDNLIKVSDISDVPFVWCYYIEGASKTYMQARVVKDIFEEITVGEDRLIEQNEFNIRLKKNNNHTADFDFFVHLDTFSFNGLVSIGTLEVYNYWADVSPLLPSMAGDSYELDIQHPDLSPMYARQTMPHKVPIASIELLRTEPTSDFSYATNLQVTVQDPSAMENYYQIAAINFPQRTDGSLITDGTNLNSLRPLPIWADDPEILDAGSSSSSSTIYLADKFFDGQEKPINFWIEHGEPVLPDNFRIIWRCVSPEWYRFVEARRSSSTDPRFRSTLDNSLTQPYSLPFNIEGGFGLFGVATQELYKLD